MLTTMKPLQKSAGNLSRTRVTGRIDGSFGFFQFPRLIAVLLLLMVQSAKAHDPGLSTATLQLGTNRLDAVLVFSFLDAGQIVEMDKDLAGQISKEELA